MTIFLKSKIQDFFGVWEVEVLINNKPYTYPLTSEFAVRKVERLIRNKKFGQVMKTLKDFKVKGFNSFEKGERDERD